MPAQSLFLEHKRIYSSSMFDRWAWAHCLHSLSLLATNGSSLILKVKTWRDLTKEAFSKLKRG